jgi:anti-sigma B factor antagonist
MHTTSAQQDLELVTGAFRIDVRPDRERVIVAPAGELDLATVARLKDELSELRSAGFAQLVLDLRAVTFLDSSALSLLLGEHYASEADGTRFRLVEGGDAVRRVLDLTGTTGLFDYVKVA